MPGRTELPPHLIAESYDGVFSFRRRIRSLKSGKRLPIPGGVTVAQLAVLGTVTLVCLIIYGVVLLPLFAFLQFEPGFWALLFVLLPGFAAAQRTTKPMPGGKSVESYLTSLVRYGLDDPFHRRGRPLRSPRHQPDEPVRLYAREYVPAEGWELPGEEPLTTPQREAAFVAPSVSLDAWLATPPTPRPASLHPDLRDRPGGRAVDLTADVIYPK